MLFSGLNPVDVSMTLAVVSWPCCCCCGLIGGFLVLLALVWQHDVSSDQWLQQQCNERQQHQAGRLAPVAAANKNSKHSTQKSKDSQKRKKECRKLLFPIAGTARLTATGNDTSAATPTTLNPGP